MIFYNLVFGITSQTPWFSGGKQNTLPFHTHSVQARQSSLFNIFFAIIYRTACIWWTVISRSLAKTLLLSSIISLNFALTGVTTIIYKDGKKRKSTHTQLMQFMFISLKLYSIIFSSQSPNSHLQSSFQTHVIYINTYQSHFCCKVNSNKAK